MLRDLAAPTTYTPLDASARGSPSSLLSLFHLTAELARGVWTSGGERAHLHLWIWWLFPGVPVLHLELGCGELLVGRLLLLLILV